MARISTYNIDQDVRADDKFIGTDSNGIITKNFTPSGIANFLNTTGAIAIAGQNNFFFQTDLAGGRKAGTISFTNGDGEDTLFSDLTTIKISKYASSTTMVLDYLQTLIGQAVFIGQTDNLNNFGIYKLLSLDQDLLEPNFYNAVFQEIESHGALLSEKYYALAVYPYTQELVPNSRTLTINGTTYDLSANRTWNVGTVTSVDLSMPPAFTVSNNPITSTGAIAVTGAGLASQYIRGDGQLAAFPSTGGGGSSVNYYLNGSIPSSIAGYQQMDNEAIIGGGTNFNLTGNGLIAQFLTDIGNPNRLEIPGGSWNFEMFFQVSSAGGNQKFYLELLKYDGSIFTLISSSVLAPEPIASGTAIDLYLTSLAVPTTPLLSTDRLAIRVYIIDNSGGRTVTLHTEDNTLCEIITTFSGGVSSLNGLTANTQYFAVGELGTDFNISSLNDTHTFNIPNAGVGVSRGLITDVVQSIEGGKTFIKDLRVNTLTIGKGGGNIASNTAIGFQAILSNTTGFNNVALGNSALKSNTTGSNNLAIGFNALTNNVSSIKNIAIGSGALNNTSSGSINIAIGHEALFSTGQSNNIAIGHNSLRLNVNGNFNTAVGHSALENNGAYFNTAVGFNSLAINTTGGGNTSVGYMALGSSASTASNVAIGVSALQYTSGSVNVAIGNFAMDTGGGNFNTAIGSETLRFNTSQYSVAVGYQALQNNTSGAQNVATGYATLRTNTTGTSNTALGFEALRLNTTGSYNVVVGNTGLRSNTTGDYNVAVGHQTLISNTTGRVNIAVGGQALNFNTTGAENVVNGFNAMLYNTTGSYNTGIGSSAMFSNLTGNNNTAVGIGALGYNRSGSNNAALGLNAGSLPSGNIVIDNSVFLGSNTKALGDNQTNQIVIGYDATGQGSNTVTLGNTSITTTRLRGTVQGGSFVKDGGTAAQYLMADGSVTIAPYKYNFVGSITLTGTLTTTNLLTITIPANSLTDYLDLRSLMVQQSGPALAGMQVRVWHNSVNDFNTATRIANYAFGTGGADLFAQMTRKFSLQSGLLFGFSAIGSNIAGEGSSANAALSIPFNPTTINYLFVSIQLNNATDTAILRNVNITT